MQHGVVRHQRQVHVLRLTTHVVQREIKNAEKFVRKGFDTSRCAALTWDKMEYGGSVMCCGSKGV